MTTLLTELQNLDRQGKDWLADLDARKQAELLFHDRHRAGHAGESDSNKKFYSVTQGYSRHISEWIATNAKGKTFLDFACGDGYYARHAAKSGAELAVGIDISSASIANCRHIAAQEGVSGSTYFTQADCENTQLPANSFDAIICSGMLHHLDLSFAIPEIRRILKPGGRCLAAEALSYNPAIKLYRMLTPALRTEWEKKHILSLADVRFIRHFLGVENVRYWNLLSLLATPLRKTSLFRPALTALDAADSLLLRVWPVRMLAWTFTFEMVKPQ